MKAWEVDFVIRGRHVIYGDTWEEAEKNFTISDAVELDSQLNELEIRDKNEFLVLYSETITDRLLLSGYVGEEWADPGVYFTADQLAAFLMLNRRAETIQVINSRGETVLTAKYGLIDYISDQTYLRERLIPVLAPMQLGDVEVPEFIPIPNEVAERLSEKAEDRL